MVNSIVTAFVLVQSSHVVLMQIDKHYACDTSCREGQTLAIMCNYNLSSMFHQLKILLLFLIPQNAITEGLDGR